MLMLTTGALTAYMTAERLDYELQTQKIQAQTLSRNLAISASPHLMTGQFSHIEELFALHSSFPGVLHLLITNEQGKPVLRVDYSADNNSQIRYGGDAIPLPISIQAVTEVSADKMTVWQPVEGGTLIGWLKIDYSLKQLRAHQAQTLRNGLIIGLAAIIMGMGLFLVFLSRPMRAIREAAEFARQLNQHRGENFVSDRSAQELEQLGEALNEASFLLHEQAQNLTTANLELRNSEEKFRAVSDTANEAIVTSDDIGRIIYLNKATEEAFGYTAEEMIGKSLTVLMPEKFHAAHQNGFERFLSTGETRVMGKTVELTGQRKDGTEFPLELSLTTWNTHGSRFFTGVMRDTSRRKQGEAAARHLANIVESSSDAIISKDLGDKVTSWNAAAERLYGYTAAEIVGHSSLMLVPHHKVTEEQDFISRIQRGEHIVRYETVRVKKDGAAVEVAVTVSPLRDAHDNIVGTSIIARDITERKQAAAQILELTLTDELTGLNNRRGFFTLAKAKLPLARRMQLGLQLFYADLDGMKTINDTLGHQVGDQALCDAADILRKTFRLPDLLARLGGDEFVVLAFHNTENPQEQIIARLQTNLTLFNQSANRPYILEMSVGTARFDPDSTLSLEDAVAQSDAAMYLTKQQRRTRQ